MKQAADKEHDKYSTLSTLHGEASIRPGQPEYSNNSQPATTWIIEQ